MFAVYVLAVIGVLAVLAAVVFAVVCVAETWGYIQNHETRCPACLSPIGCLACDVECVHEETPPWWKRPYEVSRNES